MDAVKNQKSFTLVELLVAVTIFSLISTISTGILVSSLRTQKKLLASQELSDQVSFLIEYMSRTIRMAKKDLNGTCLTTAKLNYEKTHGGQGIKFLNYKGNCQEFYLEGNLLKENKGGTIFDLTSGSLKVLNFNIGPDDSWDQNDNDQPRVTLFLEIEGKEGIKISTQTSISQRNPDVEK
jgi:prepilin-type N-terminal cleavage/methylation domain-containing protein